VGIAELRIAVASRPHPAETANGDGWLADRLDDCWQIALIDGLGHGPLAAEAADAAKAAIQRSSSLSVADALQRCHDALRGLRGAAVSIARVNATGSLLTYAGVGNVEGRLRQGTREERLIAYRGVVGAAMPRVHTFELALPAEWLLLLHTDGISSRLDVAQLLPAFGDDLDGLAGAVLEQWGRRTDDASVVIAAPA
jgi:hypothetical protein